MRTHFIPCFLLLSLFLFTGCGQTKVSGKVTFTDGTALSNGKVLFENDLHTYASSIQSDGSFDMGMLKDGEGIPAGQYRVAVVAFVPGTETEMRPQLLTDSKFASSRSSGITYDIQKKTTDIAIVVEKAVKK